MKKLLAMPTFFLALVVIVWVARDGFGDIAGGPGPDEPVTATPTVPGEPAQQASPLHEARLRLAAQLGVDPLAVRLVRIAHAGWDGCLGVYDRDALCTQQFIGGYLAFFAAGGREYRFHFGGNRVVGPIDPAAHARVSDGEPVPYELRADLNALMAEFARREVAIRSGRPLGSVVTLYITPTTFGNACQGYGPTGRSCLEKGPLMRGAFVGVAAGGEEYRYSAGPRGVMYFDPAAGTAMQEPAPIDVLNAQRMREDLAGTAAIPLDRISFRSNRDVIWPDSCMGVFRPDALCAQALLRGYLAILVDLGTGKEYRYHGSGELQFRAYDLPAGWRIGDPAPIDPDTFPG